MRDRSIAIKFLDMIDGAWSAFRRFGSIPVSYLLKTKKAHLGASWQEKEELPVTPQNSYTLNTNNSTTFQAVKNNGH